jgi:DDE superfamily endonuclease
MTRLRGRSKRGERLHAAAPFGHWGTQTFIAALRSDGLTAPWVLNGPMNREAFDIYVETQLAPTLHQGDVVILDNLAAHKSERAAKALKARGTGRVVPVPAALLSRPEPHRNGILKAEGSPPKSRRPNHRRPLARRRQHLRLLQPRRMLELPQCRWIRARLNARSSSCGFP